LVGREEGKGSGPGGHREANEVPCKLITKYTPWGKVKLYVNRCIYEPSDDTDLILETLSEIRPKRISSALDLGTGSGIIAKILREKIGIPKVVAVDISPYAIACAKRNLGNDVLIVACSSTSCLKERAFDLTILNPPYLPFSENELIEGECDYWLKRSWSVTATELETLCRGALRSSRRIAVLLYSSLSPLDLIECISSEGFKVVKVRRRKFFFEELRAVIAWRPSS
jgi:release factor glutamine methyltransferase